MAESHAHWYSETPILVDALAAAVHTTPADVCEQLEANAEPEHVTDFRGKAMKLNRHLDEPAAVRRFISDYVAAG